MNRTSQSVTDSNTFASHSHRSCSAHSTWQSRGSLAAGEAGDAGGAGDTGGSGDAGGAGGGMASVPWATAGTNCWFGGFPFVHIL